jgi:hypothetical protein
VEDCGPIRNPSHIHQNPDVALRLDEAGVPAWWPLYRDGKRMSRGKRERTFLDWLAGELHPMPRCLLNTNSEFRRRTIAQHFLLTHAERVSDGRLDLD